MTANLMQIPSDITCFPPCFLVPTLTASAHAEGHGIAHLVMMEDVLRGLPLAVCQLHTSIPSTKHESDF